MSPKQQRSIDTREAIISGAARVFCRMPFSSARSKDIAESSRISEGALYFHFASKADIALAVVERQQERMTAVLTECLASPGDGLSKLFSVIEGLGNLMSADEIVQAGIRLEDELESEIAPAARDAYLEWIRIARTLIQLGIEDGSILRGVDADAAAEFVNCVFVGAQVIAGKADDWSSLPARLAAAQRQLRGLLEAPASS